MFDWYKSGSDAVNGITTDYWDEARFIIENGEPTKINKPGSPDGELGMLCHELREAGQHP